MMKHAACTLMLALVAGCGDSARPAPHTPNNAQRTKPDQHESIGDLAAAQGGLASLGGAGNREEGATGVEIALGAALHIEDVDKRSPIKIDGVLKEWPERHASSDRLSGTTDALSFAVGVQADDAKVYVAAEVTDPKLTRTRELREHDDHVSLTIAFPSGRGALRAYEIGLYPGKPGEHAGAVKWLAGPSKGQVVDGSRLVESDGRGGFTLEAAFPWSSFAEARTTRVGLRGAFRYHDGDGSQVIGVLGTGPGSVEQPNELPALPSAAEQAVVDGLLAPRNLAGQAPKIDVFADVAGDARKERISVFGKFFTICGPGYRGGRQFFWREVGGELSSLETRDLGNRGKDDMIVRRRVTDGGATHEMLEVWAIPSHADARATAPGVQRDEPVTTFLHEIAIVDTRAKRRITNAVRVSPTEIEVRAEPAVGWDAASFHEPTMAEHQAILLPWGPLRARTFKLEKGSFVKVADEPNPNASATAASSSASGSVAAGGSTGSAAAPPSNSASNEGASRRTSSADSTKAVLDAYLRDQGLAGTSPRFGISAHVDGDATPEHVALVGRDIVVLGPAFKGGTGYARVSLTQFADDKDISELVARDVTGDGAAEIVVRGVRRVTPATGERVDVEALFIYRVHGGGIARVFGIETGREQSGKRIQGLVQFVPAQSGKGFDIDVRPGAARGWTEKTYPWPEDKPGGSIEPLLLPWGSIKSMRYTWNGTQFAPRTP